MRHRGPFPVWPHPDLEYDFDEALQVADTRVAAPQGTPLPHLTKDDVAIVECFYARHNDVDFSMETGGGGSELTLNAVLRLKDGRWAAVEAWNDYTGWGCQDGADVRISDRLKDVITYGLTQSGRKNLGFIKSEEEDPWATT